MTGLPSLPGGCGIAGSLAGIGGGLMALAALRQWKCRSAGPDPARLDPITLLPNRRQFQADAALGQRPLDAGAGHAR